MSARILCKFTSTILTFVDYASTLYFYHTSVCLDEAKYVYNYVIPHTFNCFFLYSIMRITTASHVVVVVVGVVVVVAADAAAVVVVGGVVVGVVVGVVGVVVVVVVAADDDDAAVVVVVVIVVSSLHCSVSWWWGSCPSAIRPFIIVLQCTMISKTKRNVFMLDGFYEI